MSITTVAETDKQREDRVVAGRTQQPVTRKRSTSRASKAASKAAADKQPKQSSKEPAKQQPKQSAEPTDKAKRNASMNVLIHEMGAHMNPTAFAKLQRKYPQLRDVTLPEFRAFISARLAYCPATEWDAALDKPQQLAGRSLNKIASAT